MVKQKKILLFKGTKALVVILGVHGGGVANTKWLLANGAKVSVTDLRTKEELVHSLREFALGEKRKINFILGGQREVDFAVNDLILAGPGVPRESKYLAVARRHHKRIENDASLFFRYSTNPVIAVTGTRGKTTTTLWIAELLKKQYPKVLPSGNTPDNALLKEFDRINGKNVPAVVELSSWQLEYLPVSGKAPHIAVITNLYPDHLNRYANITAYAAAKANIFQLQHGDDFLVLNYDNAWTTFFLKKKPKGIVFFVSMKSLPKKLNGLFVRNGMIAFRFDGIEQKLFSVKKFLAEKGSHNLENLLHALIAVKLYDPTVPLSEALALKLPTPRMRQEVIYQKGSLTVVNDSCATSPDGTIAAIKRFSRFGAPVSKLVLICGGTDKELEFGELAKAIKKYVPPEQLILLEGTATTKLQKALQQQKMSRSDLDMISFENLDSCVDEAFRVVQRLKGKKVILFSPGAASFEKFLHEFDRGEQFNKLVQKYIK